MDYLLPMAVLKFKQGIGRLIRTKTEKGVLVVLDPRIQTKSYGRFFSKELKNYYQDPQTPHQELMGD